MTYFLDVKNGNGEGKREAKDYPYMKKGNGNGMRGVRWLGSVPGPQQEGHDVSCPYQQ